MTEIYYFSDFGQFTVQRLAEVYAWLPEQQRDLVDGQKLPTKKMEQAVAYALLVRALQMRNQQNTVGTKLEEGVTLTRCGIGICQIPNNYGVLPLWAFGKVGKPYMTNHTGLHFNISHCKECVALALSDSEIGIDVEGRRRFSDMLLARSCNDEEQQAVRMAPDPESEFARQWTRKEAYFKWTGTGILIPRLPHVAQEAAEAKCIITTHWVEERFHLSIARSTVL